MNKLACGIAAVGLMAGSAFADYYITKFGEREKTAYGDWVMGYTHTGGGGTVSVDNENDVPSGIVVYKDGVAKLINVTFSGQYPGAFIGIGTYPNTGYPDETATPPPDGDIFVGPNGEKITDCTGGFSYWYKSNQVHAFTLNFKEGATPCTQDNKWRLKNVSASASEWTKKTVALNELSYANTGWAAANCHQTENQNVVLSRVLQMTWGMDETEASSGVSGLDLMMTNVICKTGSNPISENDTEIKAALADIDWSAPVAGSSSSGDGSSSGGYDPIVSYNSASITGLNVVSFARSLKIASGKDATVSLFDMHGKLVLSQKVFSGTTTINLEKQRQGVYYAVVKSDSHKQTVKVVLK